MKLQTSLPAANGTCCLSLFVLRVIVKVECLDGNAARKRFGAFYNDPAAIFYGHNNFRDLPNLN